MSFLVLLKSHLPNSSYTFVPEALIDWAMDDAWESEWERAWDKIIPKATTKALLTDPQTKKTDIGESVLSSEAQSEFKRLYNALATTIKEQRRQVLLFSSVNSGDGASFVCRQISRLFAESGQHRVVSLVINQAAEPENELALRRTDHQNLCEASFTFDGQGVSLERQLSKFNSFLDRLRRNFDLILIDSPAVAKFSATGRVAVQCDGTILVAREGATPEHSIETACDLFESSLAEVIGIVMNHCRANEKTPAPSPNTSEANHFTFLQEAA